jgi:hypothetical protein
VTKFYDPKVAAPKSAAPEQDDMATFVEAHRKPVADRAKRLNEHNREYFRKTLTDYEFAKRFPDET